MVTHVLVCYACVLPTCPYNTIVLHKPGFSCLENFKKVSVLCEKNFFYMGRVTSAMFMVFGIVAHEVFFSNVRC